MSGPAAAGPLPLGHAWSSPAFPHAPPLCRPRLVWGTLSSKRQYMVVRGAKREEQLKRAPEISDSDASQPSTSSTSSTSSPSSTSSTSPQPPRGPSVKSSALSSGWKRVLRPLANIKLAIAELAAIAVLSSVGTVIEQNKQPMFYVQNFPDQGTWYDRSPWLANWLARASIHPSIHPSIQ
jgi:hypothetical protein